MSSDKEKNCGCNSDQEEKACGCSGHDHQDQDACGCGGHDHDHDGCGCGGDHGHEHHSVTLALEDDTELDCPILDAFEINEQSYMALLHPVDETVLLYRFFENEDETIDLETIDSDDEFDLVSKTFLSLQED